MTLDCFAHAAPSAPELPVRVTVWDRWLGRVDPQCVYADTTLNIARGRWQRLEIPLRTDTMHPGNEVEVRLEPHGAEVTSLPEQERGLAVRRVAFENP